MTSPGGMTEAGGFGDVALQPGQLPRAGECLLVQGRGPVGVLDEPGRAGGLGAADDVAGAVLLRGEGLVVPRGPLRGERPDRPPGLRVVLAVPGGLGPQDGVVVLVLPGLRGDGID